MLSLRLLPAVLMAGAIAGLMGLTGCTSTPSMGPAADLQQAGLKPLWETHVTLGSSEKILDTWRVADSIYLSTSAARLVRINANNGTRAWEIDLMNPNYKIFRPAEVPGGQSVLVVNSNQASLINKATGEVQLQKTLEMAVNTDPIVTQHNTFCVGGVNYFYALYLDRLGGRKWNAFANNDAFVARPAVQGDSILLASERGQLWKINLDKGEWEWRDHKTNGHVTGGLAADARAVYVPCLDGNVYAFDMNNGANLWQVPIVGGMLDKQLMTTRSDVLVPTGTTLYSLTAANGNKRWEAHGVRSVGTIAGDRVWVMDDSGMVKALSLENGEVLASAPGGNGWLVANGEDRNVLLVSKTGVVSGYAGK